MPVEVPVETEVLVTRDVIATVQVPVEVTREVFIEVPVEPAPLGSAENPIRLVFAPVADSTTVSQRAAALSSALAEQTGLTFAPIVTASHAEAIDVACQNPHTTVAFLPSLAYVAAHDRCDLQIQQAGVRFGIPWSAAMVLIRGERDIRDNTDLAGATWGVAHADDLVAGLYYQALFAESDIEVGQPVDFNTDSSAVIALYDGEVDFVTVDFKPPLLPFGERLWEYGSDDPELWRRTGEFPRRSGIGFVIVIDYVERGGYQVRDARAAVLDARPLVFAATRIVSLSEPFPNDAVAFGADFPLAQARRLGDALAAHAVSPQCPQSLCSTDFFAWEGLAPVADGDYDPVRFVVDKLAWDEAAIVAYLDTP